MANKLKNMRLTSVDLVRNGANQEADICLFKSAEPAEDPTQPTTAEKNIFKRFINWLRENPAEAGGEPADPETVEKDYTTFDSLNATRESNEKLWQYTSALTESIRSIQMDQDLDRDQKYHLMMQSLGQFDEAMEELLEKLSMAAPNKGDAIMAKSDEEDMSYIFEDLEKSDPEEEWDDEEEVEDVEKFNPNHDAQGRFASAGGAGGAASEAEKEAQEVYGDPLANGDVETLAFNLEDWMEVGDTVSVSDQYGGYSYKKVSQYKFTTSGFGLYSEGLTPKDRVISSKKLADSLVRNKDGWKSVEVGGVKIKKSADFDEIEEV